MRPTASLHADQTPGAIGEKRSEVRPAQFLPQDNAAVSSDAMEVKHMLGQIYPDRLHCHLNALPLPVIIANRRCLSARIREGWVHSITYRGSGRRT